jgi:hypothetical protein
MIEVTVPEGQGVGLVVVEGLTPEKLFSAGGTMPVLEAIKSEVAGFVGDISTEDGRKEIASLARKIARSKTFIDEVGKTYNAKLKALPKEVDAERKRLWDALESLQHEIRKPLTEWEDKEKARQQGHKDAIAAMEALAKFSDVPTTAQIKQNIHELGRISSRDWEENAEFAAKLTLDLMETLTTRLAASKKADDERAELESLRAKAAEQERIEAERRRAEEEAKRIADAAERAKAEAAEQAKRALQDAEERARKAEADRIEAEQKAIRDAKEAAERAEQEKLAAIAAEQKRIEDTRRAEEAETARREADTAHKKKINNAAVDALVLVGLPADMAKSVVSAIAKGMVPNIKILY